MFMLKDIWLFWLLNIIPHFLLFLSPPLYVFLYLLFVSKYHKSFFHSSIFLHVWKTNSKMVLKALSQQPDCQVPPPSPFLI